MLSDTIINTCFPHHICLWQALSYLPKFAGSSIHFLSQSVLCQASNSKSAFEELGEHSPSLWQDHRVSSVDYVRWMPSVVEGSRSWEDQLALL